MTTDSLSKKCTKCGCDKPISDFGVKRSNKNGLLAHCRSCQRLIDARIYAEDPKRNNQRNSEWRNRNPEKRRIVAHNRRARVRDAEGMLSHGLAERLIKLQRGKCACGCKQPLGDDYHLDHIMPLALEGTNTDDNIQLLRQRCNNQKHAKHPIDFMQQRGYLL